MKKKILTHTNHTDEYVHNELRASIRKLMWKFKKNHFMHFTKQL